MALFRLEDLLAPRAETNLVLDLSSARPRSQQDFEKLLSHVPEFRIKPEKVNPEEVTVSEDSSFSNRKEAEKKFPPPNGRIKEGSTGAITGAATSGHISDKTNSRIAPGIYPISINCGTGYMDPIPLAMQCIRILDLATVDINWRMLTVVRPTTKLDEDYFTKLVELEKLRLRPRQHAGIRKGGISGFAGGITVRRIVRTNKFGVTEIRLPTCNQCSVELCDMTQCTKQRYDDFVRQLLESTDDDKKDPNEPIDEEEEKRIKEESKKEVITSMKGQALKMKQAKKEQVNKKMKKKV